MSMKNSSLLDVDLRIVVEALPTGDATRTRFSHSKDPEIDAEPLSTRAQAFLFRDAETNEVTAMEVIGVNRFLEELGLHRNQRKHMFYRRFLKASLGV